VDGSKCKFVTGCECASEFGLFIANDRGEVTLGCDEICPGHLKHAVDMTLIHGANYWKK